MRSSCLRTTFLGHPHSTSFAAGRSVLTWMIWPPPYNSKDMLGTVFETICEAAISSLDGSPSTATPLQMLVKLSSNATSADCRDLLPVSCPNMPRGCPICSSSGARNSVCPSASRTFLVRRPTTGCFDTSSTWIRSVASPPALVITIGVWPGVSWRPVLAPDTWFGHPYKLSRSLTLYGKKRPTNTAGVDGFQVLPADPFSDSWGSVASRRPAWERPPSPHATWALTRF